MNNAIQRVTESSELIDGSYISPINFYLNTYGDIPTIHDITNIKRTKAVEKFMEQFGSRVKQPYVYHFYNEDKRKYEIYYACFVMENDCMVNFEFDDCHILHNGKQQAFVDEVTSLVRKCKDRGPSRKAEISILTVHEGEYTLTELEIPKTNINLALYYENALVDLDKELMKRLNTKKDKGIVLLHGQPGTGKTTYLRYIISRVKKKVIFLSANNAGNIMSPDFIKLMLNYPDSILVIEDAENIIGSRKHNNISPVGDLLNLSDGLLADVLRTQIICTFNSDLTSIDEALMRKGRLIAKYEFKALPVDKGQQLADHLKLPFKVEKPMTVTEIINYKSTSFQPEKQQIGFQVAAAQLKT
ncbi:ATPase family protein associated with various cellular activities (AAA) [Chitinophaga skermanii]|uniref:ATPase family protein associated with various cellular activities (AAA) n=1 Tax=Chitinophaga skermanii TaxID=331697 RepID=A0A327R3J5_9BACT|nr:AAA family ATPase [Chitinophaga skermanii]RAJ10532.1 ATPase family protein associated with various cellular activities (AAA) [Chitinophaga skermanii]